MDPDQPAHPRSLIRIHAVPLQTLLQVEKLIENSMDPDLTARMRRLVWIHASRKNHYVGFVMTRLIFSFLHIRQDYLLLTPVLENPVLHPPYKTSCML
jgi:hypothetical protein